METLLVKFNVDNFVEHDGSTMKVMGNDISLDTGVYLISNVSKEFNLSTVRFAELIITLQLKPLNTLSWPSPTGICIDSPYNHKCRI